MAKASKPGLEISQIQYDAIYFAKAKPNVFNFLPKKRLFWLF